MYRFHALTLIAASLLFAGVAVPAGNAAAQSVKSVAGTYTLVSAVTERDGKKSDTFGPGAKGSLIVDSGGRYMIMINRASLPKFASNNREQGTAEENKAVVGGVIAHFGKITVNDADKSFAFNIENSTFPNWNGTVQKRPFTTTGDELKYSVAAASGGGTAVVVWKRAK